MKNIDVVKCYQGIESIPVAETGLKSDKFLELFKIRTILKNAYDEIVSTEKSIQANAEGRKILEVQKELDELYNATAELEEFTKVSIPKTAKIEKISSLFDMMSHVIEIE